jgi:alkaline phosphatase D
MPADESYPEITIYKIAFGSCHKNRGIHHPFVKEEVQENLDSPYYNNTPNNNYNNNNVWKRILQQNPNVFVWTGDIVYTKRKSIASTTELKREYDELLTNATIGYQSLLQQQHNNISIIGTWDDHDYGGNDYGKEMPQRKERQDLLLDFLNVSSSSPRRQRKGVYSSVTYGTAPRMVKVIVLDTRSGRDKHCIPSVGAAPLPKGIGSLIACITRFLTAGLNLQYIIPTCRHAQVLDDEQWNWFQEEIQNSTAQLNIIVSSIQVLTSNPFTESFGQFPLERERLLKMIRQSDKNVILLSGDVHHGEILGGPNQFIEVTSSGMTHSCVDPIYGFLCEKMLRSYSSHRYSFYSHGNGSDDQNFYLNQNFGTLTIDWDGNGDKNNENHRHKEAMPSTLRVDIHDITGQVVLSTGTLPFSSLRSNISDQDIHQLPNPVNGCLCPVFNVTCLVILTIVFIRGRVFPFSFHWSNNMIKERLQT